MADVQLYIGVRALKSGVFVRSFDSDVVGGTNSLLRNYDLATGANGDQSSQLIGTASELVTIAADIATIGLVMIFNVDATNYVELSLATGGSFAASVFCTIKPGGAPFIGAPPATFYAKANTASVRIQKFILEGPLTVA